MLRVIYFFCKGYYSMNKSELIYCDFDMGRMEEAVKLAGDAFEANNIFSKEGLQAREQLDFRTSVTLQLFEAAMKKYNEQNNTNVGFIKMLLYRGQIVALVMASEFHLFLEDMLPLLDPEDPYAKALGQFKKEDYPKNTTVLASLLAVHKDYMKDRLSDFIVERGIKDGLVAGFKSVIGCSTNPISKKISLKLGGKLIKELNLTRNGKSAPIYLLQNDLADIIKIKSKL